MRVLGGYLVVAQHECCYYSCGSVVQRAQGRVAVSTLPLTLPPPLPRPQPLIEPHEGEWQYSATLLSWKALKYTGFDTGSGLENKDEIHDALEVSALVQGRIACGGGGWRETAALTLSRVLCLFTGVLRILYPSGSVGNR